MVYTKSDAGTLAKGKEQRAGRQNPEAKKLLNQLIAMKAALLNATNTVKAVIGLKEDEQQALINQVQQ